MNGKVAKRIRHAKGFTPLTVHQLKRAYKALPYHRRAKPKEGHSFVLRRYHRAANHT